MPESSGVPIVVEKTDLYEQAVRLKSPNRFYRTGNVIFQDDFSDGIESWQSMGGPTYPIWSGNRSYQGGFSCLLTGNVFNGIRRSDHKLDNLLLGLEFSFMFSAATCHVTALIGYTNASSGRYAKIDFGSAGAAFWMGNGGNFGITGAPAIMTTTSDFNIFKVVIDANLGIYKSVTFNGYNFDSQVLGIPLYITTPVSSGNFIDTELNTYAGLGVGNIYIGHVIITGENSDES